MEGLQAEGWLSQVVQCKDQPRGLQGEGWAVKTFAP